MPANHVRHSSYIARVQARGGAARCAAPVLVGAVLALAAPSSAQQAPGYAPQPGYAAQPGYPAQGASPAGAYAPNAYGQPVPQGYGTTTAPPRSAGSCFDGERNGQESDVDCGGDCSPCEVGDACSAWRDCWSGRCAHNACEERPYIAGSPVPPGYDVETSTHDGAATARYFGAGFLGVGYAAAWVGALADPSHLSWLFAPLIGPWISLGNVEEGKILLVIDGVLQTAGGLVLFGGLIGSGKQLVRQGDASAARLKPKLQPYFSVRGAGLMGSF